MKKKSHRHTITTTITLLHAANKVNFKISISEHVLYAFHAFAERYYVTAVFSVRSDTKCIPSFKKFVRCPVYKRTLSSLIRTVIILIRKVVGTATSCWLI